MINIFTCKIAKKIKTVILNIIISIILFIVIVTYSSVYLFDKLNEKD